MLFFKRYSETINDTAQDLEQLSDPIKLLDLVHKPQKNVVYLLSNERSEAQKLAINTMQNRFEEIALARVLTIEQL